MNIILFSPWKTASTRVVNSLKPNFDVVVKEVFHEDYYEASSLNSGLSDEWFQHSKCSLNYSKYLFDIGSDSESKRLYETIAGNIVSFCAGHESGVCIQISESPYLAKAIFNEINNSTLADFRIFRSRYDVDIQCLSIFHNYLEGNSYFASNALVFFILNDRRVTNNIRAVFLKLSSTGIVLLAQYLIGLFPTRFVIAVSRYYCAKVFSNDLPVLDDVADICLPSYESELMWKRYSFACGEYFRSGHDADLCELGDLINRLLLSKSAIFGLNVAKQLISISRIENHCVAKFFYDRCFSTNLSIAADGKCRPLNICDKSSQSTSVQNKIFIKGIILKSGDGLRDIELMLDGISVDLNGKISTKFDDNGCASFYLNVSNFCFHSIFVEMYCYAWPDINLEFDRI